MNVLRITADVRCTADQARSLFGQFDNVSYGSDIGIATLTMESTGETQQLVAITDAIISIAANLDPIGLNADSILRISIDSESLVYDRGTWRRRGDVVPLLEFKSLGE